MPHLGHLGYFHGTPSHDLLRQQLLHCICTAGGGHFSESAVPQAVPDRHNKHIVASVMRMPRMAVRQAPAGPVVELQSLEA